jgi:hypothetical protein
MRAFLSYLYTVLVGDYQSFRGKYTFHLQGVYGLFNDAFSMKTTVSVVWWSGFLAIDPEVVVRFPTLPDFLRNSGSGTGSTQPREDS